MVKNVIIRILGNDLPGLHGENQTYNNLDFTLKYESNFLDTDKVFILNRLVDNYSKDKIINLLDKYNCKYIDIPFSKKIFNMIPRINFNYNQIKKLNKQQYIRLFYRYNLYLINNNKSRNFAIDYGKDNNYENIFVLDSNSFLLDNNFNRIINDIDNNKDVDYFILPQLRLKDHELTNSHLLIKDIEYKLQSLYTQEPQIVFKNRSKVYFNELIPYGYSPKAEFLNAIGVPGKWNKWNDHQYVGIYKRKFSVKWLITDIVIRLQPYNKENNIFFNGELRSLGLYKLIKKIE